MDLQPKLTGSGKLELPGTFCITDTLAPVTDGFLRRAKGSKTHIFILTAHGGQVLGQQVLVFSVGH